MKSFKKEGAGLLARASPESAARGYAALRGHAPQPQALGQPRFERFRSDSGGKFRGQPRKLRPLGVRGLRFPGPGVLVSTHQTRNKRSKARLRLSHSRSLLALDMRASSVSSLARAHETLIPGSVSVAGVACSGTEASDAVRLASAALRAVTERAAISRALAAVKRMTHHQLLARCRQTLELRRTA